VSYHFHVPDVRVSLERVGLAAAARGGGAVGLREVVEVVSGRVVAAAAGSAAWLLLSVDLRRHVRQRRRRLRPVRPRWRDPVRRLRLRPLAAAARVLEAERSAAARVRRARNVPVRRQTRLSGRGRQGDLVDGLPRRACVHVDAVRLWTADGSGKTVFAVAAVAASFPGIHNVLK